MTEILYLELGLQGLKAINATFEALKARNDEAAKQEALKLIAQLNETLKTQTDWIMDHPQPQRVGSTQAMDAVLDRMVDITKKDSGGADAFNGSNAGGSV